MITFNVQPNLSAWTNHSFVLGERCSNASNAYQCTTPGSSTAAPTGTGSSINNGGVAVFKWLSAIDYTSMSAWATAMQTAYSGSGLPDNLTVYNWANGVVNPGLNVAWWDYSGIASNGHTTLITAAPGESFADTPGQLIYTSTDGVAFDTPSTGTESLTPALANIGVNNTTVSRLQFRNLNPQAQSTGSGNTIFNIGGANCSILGCILDGYEICYTGATGVFFLNNLIYSRLTAQPGTLWPIKWDLAATGGAVNNTCIGSNGSGAIPAFMTLGNAGAIIVRNCAFFGLPNPVISQNANGAAAIDHCCTDVTAAQLTTSPSYGFANTDSGSNLASKSSASQFVNSTTDFRLKSGADCIDTGVTDTTDIPTSTDIYATSRPQNAAWDIGAFELAFAPVATTTVYIVGNGAGAITPRSTATWTVQCWGAGQAGDSAANAGAGAGWSQKNAFSATSGTPIPFSLGAPGLTGGTAGGDTWFNTTATVLANGGGSATTPIGDTTNAGGAGVPNSANSGGAAGGAGGAGGPSGVGQTGGISVFSGGCGGGASGGGTAGGSDSTGGGTGGSGVAGSGGTGGTVGTPNGGPGGKGSGGGGGYGDGSTTAGTGGIGGDDYDYGGGGGGSGGYPGGSNLAAGGRGGTPGGGGGPGFGTGTAGQGGWALIKITYPGTDADQIYILGSITTAQIPSAWPATAIAEAWGGGGNGATGTTGRGGAGGGSSGYSKLNALTVSPGSVLSSITVGGQGVNSSIAAVLLARAGGNASTTTAGTAGATGTGDTITAGAAGGTGSATSSAGGAGGGGAAGVDGAAAAGSASNTGGTGHGGAGGNADGGTVLGSAGGINNGTAATGIGTAGVSDSRGGSGGGGGGHNTTAANALGGNGGWPGGGGGGGGAGAASTNGTGATGLIRLTRSGGTILTQLVPVLNPQVSAIRRTPRHQFTLSSIYALRVIRRANRSTLFTSGSQIITPNPVKLTHNQSAAALSPELTVTKRQTNKIAAELLQDTVVITRRALRIVQFTLAFIINIQKAATKVPIALTLAELATAIRSLLHTVATQMQTALIQKRTTGHATVLVSSTGFTITSIRNLNWSAPIISTYVLKTIKRTSSRQTITMTEAFAVLHVQFGRLTALLQTEALTLQRVAKPVTRLLTTMSFTASKLFNKTTTLLQAETITAFRFLSRVANILSATTVAVRKTSGKIAAVIQAEAIASSNTTSRALQIASQTTLTSSKAVNKLTALLQLQTVSISILAAHKYAATITLNTTIAVNKAARRTILILQTFALAATKQINKAISTPLVPYLRTTTSFTKLIALILIATTAIARASSRTISFTLSELLTALSAIKRASYLVSFFSPQTLLAQESSAHRTNLSLILTLNQIISAARASRRALQFLQTYALMASKQITHAIAITLTQIHLNALYVVGHIVSIAQTITSAISKASTRGVGIAVAQAASAATAIKRASWSVRFSLAQILNVLERAPGKTSLTVPVALAQTIAFIKQAPWHVPILQTTAMVVFHMSPRALSIMQEEIVNASKQLTRVFFSFIVMSPPAVTRIIGHTASAVQAQILAFARALTVIRTLTTQQTFSLSRKITRFLLIAIVPLMVTANTSLKPITTTVGQAITSIRALTHQWALQSTSLLIVTRLRTPTISNSLAQTVAWTLQTGKLVPAALTIIVNRTVQASRTVAIAVMPLLGPIGRAQPIGRIAIAIGQAFVTLYRLRFNRKVQGADLPPFARGVVLPPPTGLPPEG